jgi:hypothetical protein
MSDDIVARLREVPNGIGGYFYKTTQQAADEIERLRRGGCARDQRTTQFCAEAVALQELIEQLRRERDAARQRVCEMCVHFGGVYRRVGRETVECRTVEEIAEVCGWDCYKEPVSKSYKSDSTPPA